MFVKMKRSVENVNLKMYAALLVLGLVPAIYSTVRVFFVGQLQSEWSYSVAGQLSWVNLIYEIINEAIILPLFYFMGKSKSDKKELSNRIKTGMVIAFSIYLLLLCTLFVFVKPLLEFMAADKNKQCTQKQ